MKKILFLLPLAVLFFSCEKEEENPDAKNVTITSVKVITVPLTDAGYAWDATDASGADVFFKIENISTVFYAHPEYMLDVTSASLPFTQTIASGYKLPSIDQAYYISLYDYDSFSGDDLISQISFTPSEYKKDKPAKKTYTDGLIQVEVAFSWE